MSDIEQRLEPWPAERQAVGRTVYELVGQEGLDAALLAAYRHTDATMTELPSDVAELEHAKFRHIALGDISPAYFQGQRRITEIIAESQDLTDYVASVYADWVAGLTNALLDNWNKTDGDRAERVELVTSLMRSVFIDIAVVADFFTEAAHERAEAEKRAALNEIASRFEAEVGSVLDAVTASSGELRSASETISSEVGDTAAQATSVAASAQQTSTTVEQVAKVTQNLADSVTEIARQVAEESGIANSAAERASHLRELVQNLNGAADRIGEVVGTISAISQQTNLLALNATIEAARAGDAGKGFAVVATEVKRMAGETKDATAQIAAQIGSVQTETKRTVDAIEEIADIIEQIQTISATIAAAVQDQDTATATIAADVQQAAAGASQISSTIRDVSASAETTSASSQEVLASAEGLASSAEQLRHQVDEFLASVLTAA